MRRGATLVPHTLVGKFGCGGWGAAAAAPSTLYLKSAIVVAVDALTQGSARAAPLAPMATAP